MGEFSLAKYLRVPLTQLFGFASSSSMGWPIAGSGAIPSHNIAHFWPGKACHLSYLDSRFSSVPIFSRNNTRPKVCLALARNWSGQIHS
jgi:hypothetical protein